MAVLNELERRRKLKPKEKSWTDVFRTAVDVGEGRDWREWVNGDGFTHLEELLIFQPKDWRPQVRQYLFKYMCDINRQCTADPLHEKAKDEEEEEVELDPRRWVDVRVTYPRHPLALPKP